MELIDEKETYIIIGICFEVHKNLGKGFNEIVYKDAIEYELKQKNILYQREKKFEIQYKNITLSHSYTADFVVFDKIILEIKAIEAIVSGHKRVIL